MHQLCTTNDIATMLRLKPATVARSWRNWCEINGFPRPIMGTNKGERAKWLLADIEKYLGSMGKNTPANDQPRPKLVKIIKPQIDNGLLSDLLNFG